MPECAVLLKRRITDAASPIPRSDHPREETIHSTSAPSDTRMCHPKERIIGPGQMSHVNSPLSFDPDHAASTRLDGVSFLSRDPSRMGLT